MKMQTVQQINTFKSILSSATGTVLAEDRQGNHYDLKDELMQYIVIGSMLRDSGEEYLLYASSPRDERRLISFLMGLNRSAA